MLNPFDPPGLLKNSHLQTVLNSVGPRYFRSRQIEQKLHSRHLVLTAEDGTRLLADFDVSRNSTTGSLVILLHGWEGSSKSSYQILTTWRLLQLGFDVLRVNFRDHGNSYHLNRELFNSTRSPEVASALAAFLLEYEFDHVFMGGYSLGGNFALRIANDVGPMLNLKAVVAVCPPVNPANAMKSMNEGWFVYEKYFFRKWSNSLRRKLKHYPELGYQKELNHAESLDDLNDFFIPKFTGFDDKSGYFSAYSISGNRLAGLQIPAYIIASKDDPIIPVSDLDDIDTNPMLTIDVQPHGGHCGFVESLSGQGWAEKTMGAIFINHQSATP